MRRQKAAGKLFFLYRPFSIGHVPNLPSAQFKGKSRIGNYGDKIMEGHVGQILDPLTGFSPHPAHAFPDILGRHCCGVVVAGHTGQFGTRAD
ncbi:hypothetical protein NLM33_46400 [Bradyrhizobium sp. CCGUVB1N3]|uniref:hypothetical protein n=1 Tax=Bradyrhizobium sp. CCGUVB1N3 TaxID=2949629 RepID=UPI0020B2F233|nr:hypothetical protein [Bradyrhizobium sp. CCGUVB1N3]MCP3477590.1 hypothetical protein [Bradyrhizobium sp. CCGUVB1N3]